MQLPLRTYTSAYSFFSSFFRRLQYTREQLLEFKKRVDDKVGQGQGEEQGGGFGGFGGFGGGSSEVSLDLSLVLLTFCTTFSFELVEKSLATLVIHVHMHEACTCGCGLSDWLKILGKPTGRFQSSAVRN